MNLQEQIATKIHLELFGMTSDDVKLDHWLDRVRNLANKIAALKNAERRKTVRAKRPVQQPQPKMPSNHVILPYAMAIVNHTAEVMGASVITRQNSNDKCDKFAIAKIKELLATSGLR